MSDLPSHVTTHEPVKAIPARATWELRQRVLRPHQKIDEMQYAGDNDASTAHFGVYASEAIVAIASVYRVPPKGHEDDGRSWQLRGMATAQWVRGTGRGAAVLRECIRHCATCGGGLMWCNARLNAVGFYESYGFAIVSEPFDIGGIGPHVVMMRRLTEADVA